MGAGRPRQNTPAAVNGKRNTGQSDAGDVSGYRHRYAGFIRQQRAPLAICRMCPAFPTFAASWLGGNAWHPRHPKIALLPLAPLA